MVDFKSLLSRPTDDIKKPLALPAGTYYAMIKGYELGESKQKKTPFVRFNFTLTGPGEDISPEDLEGVDLGKKALRTDFYLTPDSEYRLKDFIESIGIPTQGRTFFELLPECASKDVLLDVTQRNSDDGADVFNDVAKVKGV